MITSFQAKKLQETEAWETHSHLQWRKRAVDRNSLQPGPDVEINEKLKSNYHKYIYFYIREVCSKIKNTCLGELQ